MVEELDRAIEAYVSENWEQVVRDIDALVRIPSVEDLQAAAPDAPYGPEPARALAAALDIADRMSLEAHNCEGYIGYADLPGESPVQLGIIGHADVVPAGPGWTFAPYEVTRKDGYLVGRGVSDDKGPLVVALHAVNFWRQRMERAGAMLPYTVRVLVGANEETGMGDVAYYRARFEDPAFLFTPDADFPVGYGEAGICQGVLKSGPIDGGHILELEGGAAVNAVPGFAHARVACDPGALPQREGIAIERAQGGSPDSADISAYGKAAHASVPHLGRNAIAMLADYLLSCGLLAGDERCFFELVQAVTSADDGSGVGLACADDHFGPLTAVGSIAALETAEETGDLRLSLAMDFRYPTTTSAEAIEAHMSEVAERYGATFSIITDKPPFLMDPESPAIQALNDAYSEVTGEDVHPYTMKGGTYARQFAHAASFGPEKPSESKPDWVGALHAADEGISEGLLKQSLAIYIRAIGNLMRIEL